MDKKKKEKSRNFSLLLYPDCEEHKKAMKMIKENYRYASILHDKDADEETGEIKKPHWHVILTLGNSASGRYASGIAKELEISENYVQICKNKKGALRYLIHIDDSDKYQYNIEEVHGALKVELAKSLADENEEGEKVLVLIDYIENKQGIITVREFSTFCATNGYWDVYRRASVLFLRMIDEHNEEVRKSLEY